MVNEMLNLKKTHLFIAMASSLFVSGNALAEGRVSTGYLSSVTFRAVVLDGVSYRFLSNHEEKNPVKVECIVQEQKVGCEELAKIDPRNRAKAKVSFDNAGYVTRVQILDVLK